MHYALVYLSAVVASAVTLYASGWPGGLPSAALTVACIALAAVLAAWMIPRPLRAAWHRRRAKAYSLRAEMSSGLWPLAWVGWVALSLIEHAHIVRAESLT